MFDLFERAALADADVARLMGVSRAAIHGWHQKGAQPNKWIKPRVDLVLAAVRSAVEDGDLPVSKNIAQRDRPAAVTAVITAHLKKLRTKAPTS